MSFKETFLKVKQWLQSLSFRTGVIVLLCCIPFYILSFAQMLLPISVAAKGVLWTVLFGLAKTCQYGGLTILGVEGYRRLKNMLRKGKSQEVILKEDWPRGSGSVYKKEGSQYSERLPRRGQMLRRSYSLATPCKRIEDPRSLVIYKDLWMCLDEELH